MLVFAPFLGPNGRLTAKTGPGTRLFLIADALNRLYERQGAHASSK
jgi:hypothetical protein